MDNERGVQMKIWEQQVISKADTAQENGNKNGAQKPFKGF